MKTHLVKWDETYRKQGLVIIDVDNGKIDTMDKVKASVEAAKIRYATAWDEGAKMCTTYGVRGYAAAFLIGVDGTVVWEGFPAVDVSKKEALIQQELKKVSKEELEKIAKELEGK